MLWTDIFPLNKIQLLTRNRIYTRHHFKLNNEWKPVSVQCFVDIVLGNRKMSIEVMDMVDLVDKVARRTCWFIDIISCCWWYSCCCGIGSIKVPLNLSFLYKLHSILLTNWHILISINQSVFIHHQFKTNHM